MNKNDLFGFLKQQAPSTLLQLLESAFDEMTTNQRRSVFGKLKIDENASMISMLKRVRDFYDDSIRGAYYAPFDMNSKNYMNIPEETEAWFEKLAYLLRGASRLSEKGSHESAVECFKKLFQLIDKMEDGDEIIFAHESGSWMIPADEKVFIRAYLRSIASIFAPEKFAESVVSIVKRDSNQSLRSRVYKTAAEFAGKEQMKALESAIKTLKIKVK